MQQCRADIGKRRQREISGIVDQHIQPALLFQHAAYQCGGLFGLGQIALAGAGLQALRPQGCSRGQGQFSLQVRHHHRGGMAGKQLADGRTYALRAAGHQYHLAGKVELEHG